MTALIATVETDNEDSPRAGMGGGLMSVAIFALAGLILLIAAMRLLRRRHPGQAHHNRGK